MSKQCEQMSKWMSEWPCTFIWFFGCSDPECPVSVGNGKSNCLKLIIVKDERGATILPIRALKTTEPITLIFFHFSLIKRSIETEGINFLANLLITVYRHSTVFLGNNVSLTMSSLEKNSTVSPQFTDSRVA